MIITRLSGGLGNQMFQYAAGLALAHARRTILKVDVSWFRETSEWADHGRYMLDGFNLPAHFATEEESARAGGVLLTRTERWSVSLAQLLHFNQYHERYRHKSARYRPSAFRFDATFDQLPDGTLLDGLFQSERFFENHVAEVRRHFSIRFPLSPAAAVLAARIQSGASAFAHSRLGDYTQPRFKQELGVLGKSYYQNAVEEIRKHHRDTTLYLFSDDLDAAGESFSSIDGVVVAQATPALTLHETLHLMSLCDHAVIANSSFSWWGAWLGTNPEQIVIAPSPWFAKSPLETTDLVPARWRQQSADFRT